MSAGIHQNDPHGGGGSEKAAYTFVLTGSTRKRGYSTANLVTRLYLPRESSQHTPPISVDPDEVDLADDGTQTQAEVTGIAS